jgi:hypothetical protein
MSLEREVRIEIEELHAVFEAWLGGAEGASLERVEDVLAEGFRLVSPEGIALERRRLIDGLHGARGRRGSSFRIGIREVAARALAAGLILATYEEWQEGEGRKGRLSSALLREREGGGFDWLHVHETWLPGVDPDAC